MKWRVMPSALQTRAARHLVNNVSEERPQDAKFYHDAAMLAADNGIAARRSEDGKHKGLLARQWFNAAMCSEFVAAKMTPHDVQPTRSVLMRSAATLALDCGQVDIAAMWAAEALRESPPPEIAAELGEVVEKATLSEAERYVLVFLNCHTEPDGESVRAQRLNGWLPRRMDPDLMDEVLARLAQLQLAECLLLYEDHLVGNLAMWRIAAPGRSWCEVRDEPT